MTRPGAHPQASLGAVTAFDGLLLVTAIAAVVTGGAIAYGVFVEAPRDRRYAKRTSSGRRRAYHARTGG